MSDDELRVVALRLERWAVRAGAVLCGVGVRRSARTLRQLLQTRRPSAVVNLGIAGGLDPALTAGQIVLVDRWFDGPEASIELRTSLASRLDERGIRWTAGAALTVERALFLPEHKASAYLETGAMICEMEGRPLAQVCRDEGIPFAAVRVVSDDRETTLRRPPRMLRQLAPALNSLRHVGRAL